MPADGLFAACAGSVNLYSARRVNGTLQSLTGIVPPVTVAGRTVRPSGLLVGSQSSAVDAVSAAVAPRVVNALDLLQAWLKGGALGGRLALLGGSPLLAGRLPGQQLLWGDRSLGQQLLWGDQTSSGGQQLLWGDASPTQGQQLLWGDTLQGDEPR